MTTAIAFDQSHLSSLLASRHYREALDYLNLLDVKSPSNSRTDLAQIFFAYAQCLYRLGEYRKAAIKLKCSIKFADPLNDNLLYARQKYTLGQIYQEAGRLDAALNEYTEASAFFHRVKDTPRKLAAQEMMALIHFYKGNYAQARDLNETILCQAKGLGLIEHVKVVALNLCIVLLRTGDLRKTSELLGSVAGDCSDSLSKTWLESFSGALHVRLLDFLGARGHLQQALSLARENGYRRDEVVCMEYLGLNEYYEGNYTAAKRYYQEILAKPELTASAIAQTLRLLADVQVALGEFEVAEKTADKAEEAITRIKEWVELGCLHRARALLFDSRGDRTVARDCFAKSFEVLSRHGARYELAVTCFAAGQAACFDVAARFEYLRQAKSLFIDMDVPKRVAQVEQAILTLNHPHNSARIEAASVPISHRDDQNHAPAIIAGSKAMQAVKSLADEIKNTDCMVLITGETGSGKDVLAKYIHYSSNRASRPFRLINMAALPESLIELELFGCRKGAYTNATEDKPGLLKAADGGTFFLNEIGEAPLVIQAKLLDVIENKWVRQLGGTLDTRIDVRFVAATNKDLCAEVKRERFRGDLYQRLKEITIELPPLRNRKEDILALFTCFLGQFKFRTEILSASDLNVIVGHLGRYSWPGNVRELRQLAFRTATFARDGDVGKILSLLNEIEERDKQAKRSLSPGVLLATLERYDGNQSKAARELGIPESTLRYQLRRSKGE